MDIKEFEHYVRETANKFHYAFVSICFGTFALSLQFSPTMGFSIPFMLIFSWIFFFFSSLAGGLRLLKEAEAYLLNLQIAKENSSQNGNLKKNDEIQKHINILKSKNKLLSCFFKIQLFCYLSGLMCNLIFCAVNYLEKSGIFLNKSYSFILYFI